MLVLFLLSIPLFSLAASNESDFLNWTDIDGKQKVGSNATDIDLSGQAFYVSGKSVSSAKSANTAIVSASVNIGNATFVKTALNYKPTRKDVKKAKINSNSTVIRTKPRRKSSTHWNRNGTLTPVFLSLKESREKFLVNSPTKN